MYHGRQDERGQPMSSRQTTSCHPDHHTQEWISQLHHIWSIWKKNETFYDMVHQRLQSSRNPFSDALYIAGLCCDSRNSKNILLAFAVMDTFEYWLKDNHNAHQCLTEEVKQEACELLPSVGHTDMMKLIIRVYELLQVPDLILTSINKQLSKKKYKEACQIAHLAGLHSSFNVEAFLLPLILQDRLSIAEQFLNCSPYHQTQLLALLDDLMGRQNFTEEITALANHLGVDNLKHEKLQLKPIKKLVGRLIKDFNIPSDLCPNFNKKQRGGALHYLLCKRYVNKTIGEASWREMVHEAVQNNIDLQIELIYSVFNFSGNVSDSVYWARRYQIPLENLPPQTRFQLEKESNGGPVYGSPYERDEETYSYDQSSDEYLSLSLPPNSIVMVDTPRALHDFMHRGLKREHLVGLDSEWKPYFGGNRTELALLQCATARHIYLIDIVSLKPQVDPSQWHELGTVLFFNENITKIGFGLKADLKAIETTLPHIGGSLSLDKGSYLDLQSVWQRLIHEFGFVFPYPGDDERGSGEGLTNLVYLCLGKSLNKDDQFSNWERRPLRESQKMYAALDAYCLLELHSVLKSECAHQNIPFNDISKQVWHKKTHHKHKSHQHHPKSEPAFPSASFQEAAFPLPARCARIVCDTMVQGLGKKLRQLGIDTHILSSGTDHSHCVRIAHRDQRFVVTRGNVYAQLKNELPRKHIYQVRSDVIEEQIDEVLQFFNIIVNEDDVFSRCQNCNCGDFFELDSGTLCEIAHQVNHGGRGMRTRSGAPVQYWGVPSAILKQLNHFRVCDECGKCYWDGSHMQRFLNGKVGQKTFTKY